MLGRDDSDEDDADARAASEGCDLECSEVRLCTDAELADKKDDPWVLLKVGTEEHGRNAPEPSVMVT